MELKPDRLTDWERGELNDDKDGIVTVEADQAWDLAPLDKSGLVRETLT